jgi:ABC-type multidrug transport system ATPase subunit
MAAILEVENLVKKYSDFEAVKGIIFFGIALWRFKFDA